MRTTPFLTVVLPFVPSALAAYKGFNYGSTFDDGSVKVLTDFEGDFTAAKNLVGTSGFTSARLYTMIQGNTTNTVSEAIQAAVNTNTSLLLGMWASAGEADFQNELAALNAAVSQNGQKLAELAVGISVGSEDLYRISPVGLTSPNAAPGAGPDVLTSYIAQVRAALKSTPLQETPIGHVDTWTAWVNGTNQPVIDNSDFLGMDAYPYYETTKNNSIQTGNATFWSAYRNTTSVAGKKPVWVTETGWPVAGNVSNLAVASVQNAQTYWDEVGCSILDSINTWWFTLQDIQPRPDSNGAPTFGIVGAGNPPPTTPIYNLKC